jgi:hypothetical protein
MGMWRCTRERKNEIKSARERESESGRDRARERARERHRDGTRHSESIGIMGGGICYLLSVQQRREGTGSHHTRGAATVRVACRVGPLALECRCQRVAIAQQSFTTPT